MLLSEHYKQFEIILLNITGVCWELNKENNVEKLLYLRCMHTIVLDELLNTAWVYTSV